MADPSPDRVQEIFTEALQLQAGDRAAYLARKCGDDAELRSQVEGLLDALDEAGEFMKEPTESGGESNTEATMVQVPSERAGDTIGRYKLLQQIGEGGFGVVYMAEQEKPVRRKVALKIIKLGMDTKQVIARFEAERQALAMMDHLNIARVLDAGATETGRPYFVMELVRGDPITEYCDKNNLDIVQRLALFQQTCRAVQHAHHKGIIHRDIKPSNVMITLHDGQPIPKVIDFGIAKATNQRLTEKTVFTEYRQFIGTPEYMSPEQAEMSGIDIDTRSDVYSLGVLLYELLTGTTPFASSELRSAAYGEIQRIIREETPHKPSTRLSTLDTLPSVAAQRRTEPRKLGVIIRGDLDWIVMKALEKDRTRRYETANGFAADIQRYMDNEPVVASPPSTGYKLRKFIQRNRAGVTAAALVVFALLLGVAGTTQGLVWALNEKDRADQEAHNATLAASAEAEARREAVEEAERAERELARTTEIKRLITEMLQSLDPAEAYGADTTLLSGILDYTSEHLASGEITDELIAAELHSVIGDVYTKLGLYADAERHLPASVGIRTRLLGADHPDTLASVEALVTLYLDQGRYTEAGTLGTNTLEIRKRMLGLEHPDTLRSMNNLATVYWKQGRYAEAGTLDTETLEIRKRVLGPEHPDTLQTTNSLAVVYRSQGRHAEAELLCLATMEIRKRVLGPEHPDTLISMNNLAVAYQSQGRFDEAEPLCFETLEIRKRVLGPEHPSTLNIMHNLALVYRSQGRYDEAEQLYSETLEIRKRVLGPEHPQTLNTMTHLGQLYANLDRYGESAELFERSLSIRRRVLGNEHPSTRVAISGLARAYRALEREEDGLLLEREFLGLLIAAADEPDADAVTLNSAAWTLLTYDVAAQRDPGKAIEYAERACASVEWTDANYLDTLALAQHMTGDSATAVETQERAIELAPGHEEFKTTLARYVAALAGESDDADSDDD